eukprot:433242-Amphidinium_carterae.1
MLLHANPNNSINNDLTSPFMKQDSPGAPKSENAKADAKQAALSDKLQRKSLIDLPPLKRSSLGALRALSS